MQNRIKKFTHSINQYNSSPLHSSTDNKKYFTVPYVQHTSNSFKSISKKFNLPIAFTIPNTLNRFIKTGNDRLDGPSSCVCDVVYKINCKDCEASYVGQTKRRLRTKIKEHINDINKKSGALSVISIHHMENNHEFDWDDVGMIMNLLDSKEISLK